MPDPAVILEAARADGRDALLEPEAWGLLRAYGLPVPASLYVADPAETVDLDTLPGDRVVVKAVAPDLLHKSDAGGVAIVRKADVPDALRTMAGKLTGYDVRGYTIAEFVPHDADLAGELLLGARWTHDFGAVLTLGPGGLHTEALNHGLRPDALGVGRATDPVPHSLVGTLLTEPQRGKPARIPKAALESLWLAFGRLAEDLMPEVAEIEMNPVALAGDRLVPLDILVKLGGPEPAVRPARPVHKIGTLLRPDHIGIIGVSRGDNPGRAILRNLLHEGFPADRLHIVKPGEQEIDGVVCHDSIEAMPSVDLFVIAVASHQVPAVLEDLATHQRAEAVLVVPGGLEEKAGTEAIVERMRESLWATRDTRWQGPVVNGGNCVGVRSRPGGFDTVFIPQDRIRPSKGPVSPVSLVSQSGALGCALLNRLQSVNPVYFVSLGNQMDLTASDYLEHLIEDDEAHVLSFYLEGFRAHDGSRFADATRRAREAGKTVLLYLAGRSAAGAQAMASHTAAIAGDHAIATRILRDAGVIVADTLQEFEDLVRTAALLDGRSLGPHVGLISNAGYECVAMADRLDRLRPADFTAETEARLAEAFQAARIDGIVDVHNPVDLTPMMRDEGYEAVTRIVAEDPGVDTVVVGIVPMTPALTSLPEDEPRDGLRLHDRFAAVAAGTEKAVLAVVTGGQEYAPLRASLEAAGIPVFTESDQAIRILERLTAGRPAALRHPAPLAPA